MFLVAGEALMDMVPQHEREGWRAIEGGAPYNFARALALQGQSVAYLNAFSTDRYGAQLLERLQAAGARHLGARVALPTALAYVSTDSAGVPSYRFEREGVADRALDVSELLRHDRAEVAGFHSGALALVPPDDATVLAALQHFRARGVLCSVDVNMRVAVASSMQVPLARYQAAARAAAAHAHVVKVSEEDLRHLGAAEASGGAVTSALEAAAALLAPAAGACKLVVLTLGAGGAYALTPSLREFCAAPRVQVVDSVGAGDCFYAGFVAALQREGALARIARDQLTRAELQRALQHATACAAINLTRAGCAPPSWDEAQALRERTAGGT